MAAAVLAWNMMGGLIDWSAIALVAVTLGIDNTELLIKELCLIRDFKQETKS